MKQRSFIISFIA